MSASVTLSMCSGDRTFNSSTERAPIMVSMGSALCATRLMAARSGPALALSSVAMWPSISVMKLERISRHASLSPAANSVTALKSCPPALQPSSSPVASGALSVRHSSPLPSSSVPPQPSASAFPAAVLPTSSSMPVAAWSVAHRRSVLNGLKRHASKPASSSLGSMLGS